jgi:WD40 repeat protein
MATTQRQTSGWGGIILDRGGLQRAACIAAMVGLALVALHAGGQTGLRENQRQGTDYYGDALPHGALARLGTIRFRHSSTERNWVQPALAFSADGKTLASGGSQTVRLFEVPLGTIRSELSTLGPDCAEDPGASMIYDEQCLSLAFAPDGGLLALGVRYPHLVEYRVGTRKPLQTLPWEETGAGALSADGRIAVTENRPGTATTLWDVKTRKKTKSQEEQTRLLALSCEGNIVALAKSSTPPEIVFWSAVAKRLPPLTLEPGVAQAAAFSFDGRQLAILHEQGTNPETRFGNLALMVWDLPTRKQLRLLDLEELNHCGPGTFGLAFSRDGKHLAAKVDSTIYLLETATGAQLGPRAAHTGRLANVAWSRDGKTILSAAIGDGLRLWDTASGRQLHAFTFPEQLVYADFSSDGKLVSWVDREGVVGLFDVNSQREIRKFGDHRGRPRFSPDGRILSIAGRKTFFWDRVTAREVSQLTRDAEMDPPLAVAISPRTDKVVLGFQDHLDMCDLATGKTLWLAQLKSQTQLQVLNISETGVVASDTQVRFVQFSPDGRTVATSHSNQVIRLWDATTGKALPFRVRHPARFGSLSQVSPTAFSPDGKILASGGNDGTVRLWDVGTSKELHRFQGHTAVVTTVAFSADGRRLASGSGDTTAVIWDVATALKEKEK